ncbi:GNAT family N-acetyltransferase [Nonomuraea sp. ATR24]|uniref:GNAT family N-acetyltransferase n=1 Tax=Nonomuraea sp. ATR24 TaxID=1676744 RepID=UPI0035BFBAA1
MDVTWGPLTPDDAPAWAEFAAAVAAADRSGDQVSVDLMTERLANPLLDLERGTLAARVGREIVAVGLAPVRHAAEPVHLMDLWGGGVHPAHRRRGHGRRIIDWVLATAPELHARKHPGKPLHLQLHVPDDNHGLAVLAERTGFVPTRVFQDRRRDLTVPVPPPRPPGGVTIVPWAPELDDQAREVRNAAFRDHWGYTPHTAESWNRSITGTGVFRPAGSFLAVAGGHAVGCLLTHHRPAPTGAPEAWIQVVATVAEWRGRGVAGALVSHALTAFRAQGYATAGLSVDADNGTGAVSVYERAGFATFRTRTSYVHVRQ